MLLFFFCSFNMFSSKCSLVTGRDDDDVLATTVEIGDHEIFASPDTTTLACMYATVKCH